jgi:hypothetical protein
MRKRRKRSLGDSETPGGKYSFSTSTGPEDEGVTAGNKAPKVRAGSVANTENELSYV